MLDTLRDAAPGPSDLIASPVPNAVEADLRDRATVNMEKGRAAYDEGSYASAELLFACSLAQATIAQARATARLADATEAIARLTRLP